MGWMPTTRRMLMMTLNFAIALTPRPRDPALGKTARELDMRGEATAVAHNLLHHTSKTWMQSTPRLGSLTPGPLGLLRPVGLLRLSPWIS